MQIIKDLASYIDDELCDAAKYARKALHTKEEYPQLAQVFYQLSVEEMDHMNRLHNEVKRLIDKARESGEEIPKGMEEAYQLLHEIAIDKAKDVKTLQSLYREL